MKLTSSFHGCFKRTSLLLCIMFCCIATAWAQKTVTGTVVDNLGEPVIGANVLVKGTTRGVTTDTDGKFSITNVSETDILHITFIGCTAQDVLVAGKTSISVKLEEENDLLDEVVVVGYGVQKKRDLTGAITSVKTEEITINPSTNPMESLQGKVAGLDITKTSGQAGSGVNMQLRGNRSLEASGNPLFIIDGMPGDYATLNPNDIESIEVLKDASSTAIYGSSGANGVIIITTKNGKEGQTTVNFNSYLGINGWSTFPKLMNAEQYVSAMRTAYQNGNEYVTDEAMFGPARAADYQAYLNGESINWVDELLQTGFTQNYSLSVSGGSERTKSYLSLNFSDEKGQYRNDDYKVYSTNMRIDYKVSKMVNIGANIQASYTHQNKPFAKLDDISVKSPVGSTTDENGNYVQYINNDTKYINPLINDRGNYRNQGQNFKIYVNPYIRITPMKGLTWESRVNGTLTYGKSNTFNGIGSFKHLEIGNLLGGTDATVNNSRSYNYKWENILTWNKTFNKDHDVTVTAVQSWNHNRSETTSSTGKGIKSNNYLWHNIGSSETTTATSGYNMQKGMAYIARANYSYKGRYLASASMRWDGDSRLADGHRWASFPAVSAGWRISDESFMDSAENWLDNLKFRVSYGETGTAGILAYQSASTMEQGFYTLGGQYFTSYNYSKNIANHALTWERSKSYDFGADISVLRNRITLTLDYYITNTEGVIWGKDLPVVNGAYNYSTRYNTKVNLAETKNNGIEFALNTVNFDAKGFRWTSAVTYAWNKEEITSLPGTENDQVVNGDMIYKVGYPINSYFKLKTNGVWADSESADAAVFGAKPGDLKFDIPGMTRQVSNGEIQYIKDNVVYNATSPYSVAESIVNNQVLGHNSPDFTLGFKNDFTYKNFDLSIYMFMRWGQMIQYKMLTNYDTQVGNNFPVDYLNHIGSYFPALNSTVIASNIKGFSSLAFVDGSFFKIKNITLGYNVPSKYLKKALISKCRVYGTITNPLIVAKSDLLKDYDPEMNGSVNYPLTKQLVFGLNVTF